MRQERNLEEIDSDTYDVKCRCGWSEPLLGAEAIAHWVVLWEKGKEVQDLMDRLDENRFSN
jgi:hypothetical protein